MCCGCDTSYIVSVHIQCEAAIYTLSLCRGHSWRVRLAKQETLTPPGHLVSRLVCRGPWISTVVLIVGATMTMHQSFVFDITITFFMRPIEINSESIVRNANYKWPEHASFRNKKNTSKWNTDLRIKEALCMCLLPSCSFVLYLTRLLSYFIRFIHVLLCFRLPLGSCYSTSDDPLVPSTTKCGSFIKTIVLHDGTCPKLATCLELYFY